ncbi:MAG: UPF0149 family protein [Granulosicoccus sp.]
MNLSYQNLDITLDRLNIPLPVPEVHGLCCGLLCSMSAASAKTRWFTEVLDAASLTADSVAEKAADIRLLDEWFTDTVGAMNDAEMEFYPCLPDDDASVKSRIRALGDFCSGFTYGIGIADVSRTSKSLPKDTREIIDDFQAIEAAEDQDGAEAAGSESEEFMFLELSEYVRVGVLLILEELRPVSQVKQEQPS